MEKENFPKNESPKAIPVGDSRELEEKKETIPAIEMKNHVIWVNPSFPDMPFNLKEGQASKLGLFLTPEEEIPDYTEIINSVQKGEDANWEDVNVQLDAVKIEIWKKHGRSGLIGRIIFQDKDGNIFRDIDLKGIGNLYDFGCVEEIETVVINVKKKPLEGMPENYLSNEEAFGIQNKRYSQYDMEMTEKFAKAGIRTNRILAIIALEEIVINSSERNIYYMEGEKRPLPRKISIAAAKKRGFIPKDSDPVVEVRAFGTKARIGDRENILSHLEDAKKLVAEEFGLNPSEFDTVEYLKWFAKTMGVNFGRMHKKGWLHNYIGRGHNVTLDARIVDLDSVITPRTDQDMFFSDELKQLKKAMAYFAKNLIAAIEAKKCDFTGECNVFSKLYEDGINYSVQKAGYGEKVDRKILEKILEEAYFDARK